MDFTTPSVTVASLAFLTTKFTLSNDVINWFLEFSKSDKRDVESVSSFILFSIIFSVINF